MKDDFLKRFPRYQATREQEKILDAIGDFHLEVDRERRRIHCTAEFSRLIPFAALFSVERSIKEAYSLASFRFFPHYGAERFDLSYVTELIEVLKEHYESSIGRGYFEGSTVTLSEDGSEIGIALRDGMSPGLLYASKVDEFLESAIHDCFDKTFDVRFSGNFSFESIENDPREQELRTSAMKIFEERTAVRAARGDIPPAGKASFDPLPEESLFSVDAENPNLIQSGRYTFDVTDAELIYGTNTRLKPMPIRSLPETGKVCFLAKLFDNESKESRDFTATNYRFSFTDLDSSIAARLSVPVENAWKAPKNNTFLMVAGNVSPDKFDNEPTVRISSLYKVKRVLPKDTAPEKRIELHLHTNMSANDAVCDPAEVMRFASEWGWKAVAVTDHGNVQSYPEIMKAQKTYPNVKPLFGMEGYLVDDTARAVFGYDPQSELSFAEGTFIVFDIETTGLSPLNCAITEIGAVRYEKGEIVDVFETFADPAMPIPANITQLTGITDEMVSGAPSQAEAVQAFLDFASGEMLVAHNANFDISFIRMVSEQNGLRFENPYLDTVALSRYLNKDLSKHNLDALRKYYNLGEFNHHRASDDCKMLTSIFACMIRKMEPDGIHTVTDMENEMANHVDAKKLKSYHVSILVQTQKGLKNLYKLISYSYLDYYYRNPRLPKTVVNQLRDGLLIGSACEAGEIFQMILENRPASELKKTAGFYDYFEIMPKCNNHFLIDEGKLGSDEASGLAELERINKRILALADEEKKPVVATGDVHFLEKSDEIYRQLLKYGQKFSDAMRDTGLYLKTTDEMLQEFSYLGEDRAYEVVVTNPNRIADSIDDGIKPIPDGTYTPEIVGAEEELQNCCFEKAKEMYGDPLPELVEARTKKELDSVISHGFAVLYIIARKLVQNSESHGFLVGSRGSVGSSLIAHLASISEVNPLPPHYRCPKCKASIFITDGSIGSGFDLPPRTCEKCGEPMIQDGHDIPFETFLGFNGDKAPDIDLNFSGMNQSDAHKYTEVLFGKENIFRAGTVGTIASKTAYGYVRKYLEDQGIVLNKAETNRLTQGCVGIKRTTGQHPGGIVVIPKQYEIYDFTPVQHPADKEESGVITTHFAFEYLHDTILKLDILGHDVPTIYKYLTDYTGIDVRTVPLNDPEVLSLFGSPEALGASEAEIGCNTGTFGLPEFGTNYVREMMMKTHPKNFSDLLQISGLSHGTGIWLGNGDKLIEAGTCTIDTIIGTRDSIMLYLLHKNMKPSSAFKIMEAVRKGRGVSEEFEKEMLECNVPEWYIASCKKIKYMFPKAHAAAYVISALRLGWYKVHRPLEFYATYFTARPDGFDAALVMQPKAKVVATIAALQNKDKAEKTAKDDDIVTCLQMVNEMYARHIEFLPINLYRSKPFAFFPEDGKIRLPLIAMAGLGETVAEKISEAVSSGKVATLEELKTVAGISKTVVDMLVANDCLGGMPETSQITMF